MRETPNPGSDEALASGCICAVLDNNHGKFPYYVTPEGEECWWITIGCPIHTPDDDEAEDDLQPDQEPGEVGGQT